jgi:hypothetical protein
MCCPLLFQVAKKRPRLIFRLGANFVQIMPRCQPRQVRISLSADAPQDVPLEEEQLSYNPSSSFHLLIVLASSTTQSIEFRNHNILLKQN